MKRNYENVKLELVLFNDNDFVRTSINDNVSEFPDYPEDINFGS